MKIILTLLLALFLELALAQSFFKDTNGKWGFKDTNGKIISTGKYENRYDPYFSEDMALVMQNNKYGFVDKKGNETIPLKYDFAEKFRNGLAVVNIAGVENASTFANGRWMYVDHTGKEVINLGDNTYYKANSFNASGRALLTKEVNNKIVHCFIDKTGKIVTQAGKQDNNNGKYEGGMIPDWMHDGKVFQKGTRHGKGIYTWANGDKYEGDWNFGERTGFGKYTYANGKIEEGQFANNVFQNSTSSSANASGTKAENKKTIAQATNKYLNLRGANTYKYDNGTYFGQTVFGTDVPSGEGGYFWKNGDKYEGEWIAGKRNGYGKYTYADGRIEEGEWENNVFKGTNYLALSGSSTASYSSGKYEGQMVNGIENGLGKFVYANAAVYEGQWKNGLPDGFGKMVLKNGTTYHGTFTKGYFTKGKIFKYLRNVAPYEVIPYLNNLMVYVKGWKSGMIELSSDVTWSPDEFVEVLGWRDDQLWYGGFVNKQELASVGKTIENSSTYGYHDSKKSANVVVSKTSKTDLPATYKTIRVPSEGSDENGYKTRLPLDRSKFSENHLIMPHRLVLDKNQDPFAPTKEETSAAKTAAEAAEFTAAEARKFVLPLPLHGMTTKSLKFKQTDFYQFKVEYTGEVKYDKANGYGEAKISQINQTKIFSVSKIYKGYWQGNQQQGKGIMEFYTSYYKKEPKYEGKYEGEWKNGKQHGKGIFTNDSYTYAGDFQEGNETGYGKKTYKDGRIEEGYFLNAVLKREP